MDSELLRRACLKAGLPITDRARGLRGKGWGVKLNMEGPDGHLLEGYTMPYDHPALPSYVADILVGMVRERAPGTYCVTLERITGTERWPAFATPAQRITAAMETLG